MGIFKFGRSYDKYDLLSYGILSIPGAFLHFPIIRRVIPRLLANDIVSVQAMEYPSGLLFYFEPKTSKPSFKFGRIWKQQ